jgi:hypothetical protein
MGEMDMLGIAFADACGGTSILLLFPTNCCGVFLFQFFLICGECRDRRDASVRTRKMRDHAMRTPGHSRAFANANKKNQGFPGFFLFFMNFASVWWELCEVLVCVCYMP